jgi:L-ascorbate metabolism protein UlaG (beta-lactamase superfamily)
MRLTYLGHSAVSVRLADRELLIDPFLSDNPKAASAPEAHSPSHIVLTHAHGDHLGDTVAIARRSGATVVSSFEIVTKLGGEGVEGRAMNIGGGADFPFGRLVFTPAWHSNSFPDGSYGGMPMGVVLEAEGKRVYHAGDTALFSDMALIGRPRLDLAFLPIGDTFTMGPADALEAVRLLSPRHVVPIHYDTFAAIEQDAEAFARAVEALGDVRCHPLAPGASVDL